MHISHAGLIFIVENASATLIGVDKKLGDELIIPPIIKGFPLEHIGNGVFAKNTSLVNVGIPASVKVIGENAFANCLNLTNVKFYKTPKTSTTCTLQKQAFYNCRKLKLIHFPEKVLINGESVFHNCESLSDIKGKFNSLLAHTFDGCNSLKSLLFYGKTFVSTSAFGRNSALERLTFLGDLSPKTSPLAIAQMQQMKIVCYPDSEFVNWAYEGTAVEIMEVHDFFDF